MQQFISILNDSLRIPLSVVAACNYTKTSNVIPIGGTQLTVKTRGYGCQEFAISFTINNATLPYFKELNQELFGTDATLEWVIQRFISLSPQAMDKSDANNMMNPSHIFLANQCVCPELLFMLTSVTHTIRGDRNGHVLEADISLTLSGCKTSKKASVDPLLGDEEYKDVAVMPIPTIHVGAKELKIQEILNITRFELTPTTMTLEIDASNVQSELQAFLIGPLNPMFHSYIEVPGVNNFYIRNATYDEPFITYECDIFKPEAYENISKTFIDVTLQTVLMEINSRIPIVIHGESLKKLKVNYFKMNSNAIEALNTLAQNLGFLVAYHESYAHIIEVPENITAEDELLFYVQEDIMSAKTCKVIYRDSMHQYTVGDETLAADTVVIDSPICTFTDRSENLLRYYNLMENQLTVNQPYDNRIRQMSIVRLQRDDNTTQDVLITNYVIDVLTNEMSIECHYI